MNFTAPASSLDSLSSVSVSQVSRLIWARSRELNSLRASESRRSSESNSAITDMDVSGVLN